MNKREEWTNAMANLAEIEPTSTPAQRQTLSKLWNYLEDRMQNPPLPIATMRDNVIDLVWDNKIHFDIQIHDDGDVEWFFTSRTNDKNDFAGSETGSAPIDRAFLENAVFYLFKFVEA